MTQSLSKRQIERLPFLTPRQASLRMNAGHTILILDKERNSFKLVDQNRYPNMGMYELMNLSKKYTLLLFCPDEADQLYYQFDKRKFYYLLGTLLLFLSVPFLMLYFHYPEKARLSKDQCLFLGLSLSLIGTHFMVKLAHIFEEYYKAYREKFYPENFD